MTSILVPYFQSHRDPQLDRPSHFVSFDQARQLKKAGTHYCGTHALSSHRGVRAIIEVPQQALPEVVHAEREAQRFSGCVVVGQTPRPAVKLGKLPSPPGDPNWALVR